MPTTNQTSTVSMELCLPSKRVQDAPMAAGKAAKAVRVAEPAIGIGAVADAAAPVVAQAAAPEVTGAATLVAEAVGEDAKNDLFH